MGYRPVIFTLFISVYNRERKTCFPECTLTALPPSAHTQTVLMDRERLDALGLRLQMLVLEASVLLLTSAQCGAAVLSLQGFVGKLRQATTALLQGSHTR